MVAQVVRVARVVPKVLLVPTVQVVHRALEEQPILPGPPPVVVSLAVTMVSFKHQLLQTQSLLPEAPVAPEEWAWQDLLLWSVKPEAPVAPEATPTLEVSLVTTFSPS